MSVKDRSLIMTNLTMGPICYVMAKKFQAASKTSRPNLTRGLIFLDTLSIWFMLNDLYRLFFTDRDARRKS